MRVLYLHQHFTTPAGMSGTRSYEISRRLLERGHRVTVVCGSSSMGRTGLDAAAKDGIRRGVVDGIDVVEIEIPYSNYDGLAKRAASFLRFAGRSIRISRSEPYDLIYATSTPLTAGIPGIAQKLLGPRRPFVFEVRDLWPELPRALGLRNPLLLGGMSVLERLTYRAMDGGVALSPGILDGMRRHAPADREIVMVPNGCDLDLFRPGVEDSPPPPGFPAEGLRCVFTGAHGVANGLDSVLDAARVLLDRDRRDIHLIFIGDGSLKPELIRRREREGLTNCIFLDPMPKARLSEAMAHADVGLMVLADVPAFYFGTSPNKFFDYIAAGIPVVNNYPGWLAGMIEDHDCGTAVPPRRADFLADALIVLADDPVRRAAMGRRARELAETHFDRIRLADELIDFLEAVAAERGGRSRGV